MLRPARSGPARAAPPRRRDGDRRLALLKLNRQGSCFVEMAFHAMLVARTEEIRGQNDDSTMQPHCPGLAIL
jgi:hypothetical protein